MTTTPQHEGDGLPEQPSVMPGLVPGDPGVASLGVDESAESVRAEASVDLDVIENAPVREIMRVALPSVVTMTSYTLMQFVDKLMVKEIGPEPVYVSAQGNGGILAWVLMSFALGLTGLINTFVSQNLGAGKPERGAAYAWNGIWFSTLYWAVLVLPAVLWVPAYFRMLGHTGALAELETTYATIVIGGCLGTLLARTLSHYFYGMHRPGVVMVAAITGNIANFIANAVLIFGSEGIPAAEGSAFGVVNAIIVPIAQLIGLEEGLGVAGAAWGTVIAGGIEFLIPLAIFLSPRMARAYGTRSAWRPSLGPMKGLCKLGWPAGLMFLNEILCWQILMTVLIGKFGPMHNTAGWIALGYMHLSFMPAVGVSIAVTAVVGRCMGAGRADLAAARAWLGLGMTLAYMGVCGVLFVVFREPAIELFIDDATPAADRAELIRIGAMVMIAAAVFQLFDAVGIVISAALRGAGDTIWPGMVTVISSWVCIVGLGWLLTEVAPGLGSLGPWIGASAYIIVMGSLMLWRFVRGGWRDRTVVDEPIIAGGSA